MAKRSRRKDPPMPRSVLRDKRPPLPNPEDDAPESDSLRVLHYNALRRLLASLTEEPPVAPIQDEVLFEVSLESSKENPSDVPGTLHVIVSHRKDEHLTAWFAVSRKDDDERSTYVPLGDDDIKFLCKTIFYDYTTDHPNALFYLPLTGPRVRHESVNESPSDSDMLWYWFDVLDLKYKFQVAVHPSFAYWDTVTVTAELDDVLEFLQRLGVTIRKTGILDRY